MAPASFQTFQKAPFQRPPMSGPLTDDIKQWFEVRKKNPGLRYEEFIEDYRPMSYGPSAPETQQGWPLYPAPPVTTVPTGPVSPEKIMNPRDLPSWLFSQFPENYSYYDNLQKGLTDQSWQLQQQAMETYNQRQQEMSRLFNEQTAALRSALDNAARGQSTGIGSLSEAARQYQGFLAQALALQDEALKSNPRKYQAYIDTGTLPEGVDSQLRALRDQAIASARIETDRQKAQALAQQKQRASAMGMQDSDYAAQMNARLASEAGRAVADVIDAQNAQYIAQRLQQPYTMQEAAIKTMQSYNPFIGNVMAGGAQAAQNLQQLGKGQLDAAANQAALQQQAFSNILAAGDRQMTYPVQYYQMAQNLPNTVADIRNNYLGTMMQIWQSLLNDDLSRERLDAEYGDDSFFDFLF